MRIVAGEFKSRQLKAPSWEGLRPTSDRLRETLFNILGAIDGARVLDGYAGTGAIGIEALSRGAAHVTFVDRDPRAVRLIEENLARVMPAGLQGRPERYAIIRAGFDEAARRAPGAFDIIVLDPPYAAEAVPEALDAAARLTSPATRLVIEHAKRYAAPPVRAGLRCLRTVVSGDSALSFFGAADER